MEEQIRTILLKYINDMIAFQPEYEYGCYERGYYPKTLYQRIFAALHNTEWIEYYLKKNNADTDDCENWKDIFIKVRDEINIPTEVGDYSD